MIQSAVVSEVVPVGFADLAQAAEELPGQELTGDGIQLKVRSRIDPDFAGAIRFDGSLRTTPSLMPSMKVEVVVSPWSACRSEVAIYPVTNIGDFHSLRASRFFSVARSILPTVIDRLGADVAAEVRVALEPAA